MLVEWKVVQLAERKGSLMVEWKVVLLAVWMVGLLVV